MFFSFIISSTFFPGLPTPNNQTLWKQLCRSFSSGNFDVSYEHEPNYTHNTTHKLSSGKLGRSWRVVSAYFWLRWVSPRWTACIPLDGKCLSPLYMLFKISDIFQNAVLAILKLLQFKKMYVECCEKPTKYLDIFSWKISNLKLSIVYSLRYSRFLVIQNVVRGPIFTVTGEVIRNVTDLSQFTPPQATWWFPIPGRSPYWYWT